MSSSTSNSRSASPGISTGPRTLSSARNQSGASSSWSYRGPVRQ
uniref:Uncharacterized protein n=1 Tax=Arundo donax TaxID=35708 RepID=A0A0A8YER8_ARUDO